MKAKEYFSYNLKLNLVDGKGHVTDRKPWKQLYVGMFFSVLLMALGIWELCDTSAIAPPEFAGLEKSAYTSYLYASVFDWFVIVLGFFSFVNLFASLIRYKKIAINNGVVTSTYRGARGYKRTFREKLKNYRGIMLRVQFTQIGMVAKNRYIVELIHKDYQKNVPLYISTNPNKIRKIWIEYAKTLGLDCAEVSQTCNAFSDDDCIEIKSVDSLEKSLKQQVKEGSVLDDYSYYDVLPETISFSKKRDKIILKARKFSFDIFNVFLSILLVFVCAASLLLKLYIVVAIVLVISLFFFNKKDKLVIKKLKLVKVDKYGFFSKKVTEIFKDDIKAVSVNYSPLTDRYYIAIYSDDNFIVFAKKMPITDLVWVKKFLINRIVR